MTGWKGMQLPAHMQATVDEMMARRPQIRSQNEKHFLVCPNYVISKNDGQQHYISEHQLMRLYGVEMRECVISCCPQGHREEEGLLWLEPNYDGDYSLPDVWDDPCLPYQSDDSVVQGLIIKSLQTFSEVFYVIG